MEEFDLVSIIPELIAGFILMGFAWAFRSWSITLRSSSEKIIEKLDSLATDFHSHKLMVEHRVTSIESNHLSLQRQVDRLTAVARTNGGVVVIPPSTIEKD